MEHVAYKFGMIGLRVQPRVIMYPRGCGRARRIYELQLILWMAVVGGAPCEVSWRTRT